MTPRLPRLLDAALREVARLRPSRLSISPNGEDLSSASMTLPQGEPRVPLRAFVELYTAQGSAGIYRVTSRGEEIGGDQQLTLKHGLCTLEDDVFPGEDKLTGGASTVLSAILGCQTSARWALGSVDPEADAMSVELEYSNTNALELLQNALEKFPDFAYSFDQSASPWRLDLVKLAAEDGAEARLSRNLKSASLEEDDSELCTRVYVSGREGYTDGPTVSEYGVIARVLTVPDGATEEQITGYVDAYLQQHQRPTRTLTLDALDLSRETGEELDAFRLYKNTRLPLPRFGETLRERITGLSYPDVFGEPQSVRVTAGSRPRDLGDMIAVLQQQQVTTDAAVTHVGGRVSGMGGTLAGLSETVEEQEQKIIVLQATDTQLIKDGETVATRLNDVSIRLDATDATIALKADSTVVSEQGKQIAEAAVKLDAINQVVESHAGTLNEQGNLISGAVERLNGIDQTIEDYAGKFDDQGKLIEGAGLRIDGIEKSLTLYAKAEDVSSQIKVASDSITSQVTALDGRVSTVVQTVDGFDQRITDAAGNASTALETATKFERRITSAEGNASSALQTANMFSDRITDAEGNASTALQTAQSFSNRIDDAEGNASTALQTANNFLNRIESAEGNASEALQTANGFSQRITDAEGNASEALQTANGFSQRITDAEGNASEALSTASSFSQRITDAEGNASEALQTANGFSQRITDAEGNASEALQTANGFSQRITDAEGNANTALSTANSFEQRISDAEGNISTIEQTANSVSAEVKNARGDFSSLKLMVDSITSSVSNAVGNISRVKQTADSVLVEVTNARGNYATLKLMIDSITSDVKDANGNASSALQTASKFEQRISDAEGNISTIEQTANSVSAEVKNARGSYASLKLMIDSITSDVKDANGNASSALQTASKFEQRISDAEGNISTIEQTASGLSITVGTLQDGINTNATNINNHQTWMETWGTQAYLTASTAVQPTNIITSINATSESVTIAANRVNLVGFVTAENLAAQNFATETMVADEISSVKAYVETLVADYVIPSEIICTTIKVSFMNDRRLYWKPVDGVYYLCGN